MGWEGPPFCPRVLASTLGIRVEERQVLTGEAQLIPLEDGKFRIDFDPRAAAVRQNYSIDHEIAHTLFPDCAERRRHRGATRFNELERLCQVAAAEMLLPEDAFRRASARCGVSLDHVVEIGATFAASHEAVVRRLVALSEEPVAAVFFSRRLKPTERADPRQMPSPSTSGPEPKMRVLYTATSITWDTFIPQHKSVSDTSPVVAAENSPVVHRGRESWGLPALGTLWVQAMGLPPAPNTDPDKAPGVVALVRR